MSAPATATATATFYSDTTMQHFLEFLSMRVPSNMFVVDYGDSTITFLDSGSVPHAVKSNVRGLGGDYID